MNGRIGVVGLGTGTLACYAWPGQRWRFYEIDPTIVELAGRGGKFSFLRRCAPDAPIVMGDARLTLAKQAEPHDLLVVDAFSSDAVPMHLLTMEAFDVYDRALAPGGLLMLHISNRYIDLEPVLAAVAKRKGWTMLVLDHTPSKIETAEGASASSWVAAARDPRTIERLMQAERGRPGDWRAVRGRAGFAGWSDDSGSILSLLGTKE